jgi:hypothetical protein
MYYFFGLLYAEIFLYFQHKRPCTQERNKARDHARRLTEIFWKKKVPCIQERKMTAGAVHVPGLVPPRRIKDIDRFIYRPSLKVGLQVDRSTYAATKRIDLAQKYKWACTNSLAGPAIMRWPALAVGRPIPRGGSVALKSSDTHRTVSKSTMH